MAQLRVRVKVFSVRDHCASHMRDGQDLLLSFNLGPFGHAFDVRIRRPLHFSSPESKLG